MGSLDKRLFAYVGIVSAVLFFVAAAMVLMNGAPVSSASNDAASYVLVVAGVLAIVYSLKMLMWRDTFVQTVCGALTLIAGVLFAASAFAGDTVLAVTGIVAVFAMVADLLSMWLTKTYGAMYVSALFAAICLCMSIMGFTSGEGTYQAGVMIATAVWLIVSSYVSGFMAPAKPEAKPARHNSAPKAAERRPAKIAEKKPDQREALKAETVKAEPKPEAKAEPKPEAKVEPTQPKHEQREAPKAETVKAEPKPEAKQETALPKPAEKPKNDFMSKLVSSRDASSRTLHTPKPEAKADSDSAPYEHKVEESTTVTEEPVPKTPAEDVPDVQEEVPVEEPEHVETIAEEPATEDVEEVPEESEPAHEPVVEDVSEDISEEPATEAEEVESDSAPDPVPSEDNPEREDEELGEDIFTDYSPEAVVRRAAWNKGLRCRRGYGEHNIPVAFVKGKVAVYVQPADADTSMDDVLKSEGWTVLRYDEAQVTDGKKQGEEIAAAVKANMREAKASAKKKKKGAKK